MVQLKALWGEGESAGQVLPHTRADSQLVPDEESAAYPPKKAAKVTSKVPSSKPTTASAGTGKSKFKGITLAPAKKVDGKSLQSPAGKIEKKAAKPARKALCVKPKSAPIKSSEAKDPKETLGIEHSDEDEDDANAVRRGKDGPDAQAKKTPEASPVASGQEVNAHKRARSGVHSKACLAERMLTRRRTCQGRPTDHPGAVCRPRNESVRQASNLMLRGATSPRIHWSLAQ
jgi:hypothetical protein